MREQLSDQLPFGIGNTISALADQSEAQASLITEAVEALARARSEMHKSWCGPDGCCGPCCEISDSLSSLKEGAGR
jgi:hypothetical protein